MRLLFCLVSFLALFALGCDKAAEDFVRAASPTEATTVPALVAGQRVGPQISSGAELLTGAQVKTQATMNMRQQVFTGTQVKAVVTFDQTMIQ